MTNEDLVDFIEWEGGVEDAIRHGLSQPIDDDETAALWEKAVKLFEEYEVVRNQLTRHIGY